MIRNWTFLTGGPPKGRLFRYLLVLATGWLLILILAATFFVLSPRKYNSGFTLILPGAGASSSVNLDSLGQASSNATSPFGDHSLSPTENYRQIFQSYRLRGQVAEHLNLPIEDIEPPRIKLANQTKLMFLTFRAASPDHSKALADTWLTVFEDEVNALRAEEQELRERSARAALAGFEAAVETSRKRIIEFQSAHGLISIEQFQELVAQTDVLRAQQDRAKADMQVSEAEINRLSALLGMNAAQAADVMTLLSDATFQSIYITKSDADTRLSELSEMFGPNHPELVSASEESAGLTSGLVNRGRALLGYERFGAIDEGYYSSSDERSGLISSLVQSSVKYAGAATRYEVTSFQLVETQARVSALSEPATQLDALLRDHQVAETVFASALARMDANRTDIFASYPLTQTIETPALPDAPATPSKKFIAFGTFAIMFLYAIGLALLWIRLPIIRALLKTL